MNNDWSGALYSKCEYIAQILIQKNQYQVAAVFIDPVAEFA